MAIRNILIPVALPQIPRAVLRQAALLCRLTDAQIILLHVVSKEIETPQAEESLADVSLPELDPAAVSRLARFGDPARQILQAAREHQVDLIMLTLDARWRVGEGWKGPRVFQRFLLRSVAARIVEEAPCSVWTVRDNAPAEGFGLRRILCYLDLVSENRELISRTSEIAAAADAALTLVHFTQSMEISVPGGSRFAHLWHDAFTNSATRDIAKLQSEAGTGAEVIIENGGDLSTLIPALEKTGADLAVVGHFTPQTPSEDYADIHCLIRNATVPLLISKGAAGSRAGADVAAPDVMPVKKLAGVRGWLLRRGWAALLLVALAIVLGVGLVELAFYTALHPTGMCSTNQPNCDLTLKPGEAGRGN